MSADTTRLRSLAMALRDDLGLRGRWGWFGNVRHGEPYLATAGHGRQYVIGPEMRHEHVTYTPDWDDFVRSEVADCGRGACPHDGDDGCLGTDVPDPDRSDPRPCHMVRHDRPTLAVRVLDSNGYARLKPAHELAIYEVAPAATSEDDPSVYRHDIVGLRSPVADYLAALDAETVLALVDEIDRLRSLLGLASEQVSA